LIFAGRLEAGTRRRAWRRLIAVGVVLGGLVVDASPASAHAQVVSSTPAQGAHLTHPPSVVTVVFDQPVKPDRGGLVVLNATGEDVDSGAPSHPAPDVLEVPLRLSLGDGAYVADYTVTSVDGHVVSGGIVFLVGNASAATVARLTRPRTSLASRVDQLGQFLTYLGVLVAAGLAFFLAFIVDGPAGRRLGRGTALAAGLGMVGMLVTVLAQATLATGGVSQIWHWNPLWQALDGKLGAQFAVQLAGLAACLGSLVVRHRMGRQFAAFYGLLAAAGGFVLFGHALVSRERWVSIPADVAHAVFAAMWAGGLIGLVSVVRGQIGAARSAGDMAVAAPVGRPAGVAATVVSVRAGASTATTAVLEHDGRADERSSGSAAKPDGTAPPADTAVNRFTATATTLGRFSTMAGISFAVIISAGVLLAVAEVGSVSNLFRTGYGQLLLLKVALVMVLVFLAGYNRMLLLPVLLRDVTRGETPLYAGWGRLLGTIRAEAVGMVGVLAVTAVLANGTPSNGAVTHYPPARPFLRSQPFDGGRLQLHITPNQALVNQWTVTLTGADGRPQEPESVSIYLIDPARGIGPIETDMRRTGPGVFTLADSPDPPVIGQWQIVVQVQVSAFSQLDVSFADTVNP
jgi:copper transport protein